MNPSTPSLSPDARRVNMGRPFRIGLGIGLIILLMRGWVLVGRDTLKTIPGAEVVVNATLNLVPLLAASIGAYMAPARKMAWGVIIGLTCQLPFLLVGLLVLNWVLIVLWPMVLAVLGGTIITVVVGTGLGTWLSRVFAERRSRSLPPQR